MHSRYTQHTIKNTPYPYRAPYPLGYQNTTNKPTTSSHIYRAPSVNIYQFYILTEPLRLLAWCCLDCSFTFWEGLFTEPLALLRLGN